MSAGGSNGNAINISDKDFTNLGQWTTYSATGYGVLAGTVYARPDHLKDEGNGVYKWVVPPADVADTAYVRISGLTGSDGSVMIVTVNEEIK